MTSKLRRKHSLHNYIHYKSQNLLQHNVFSVFSVQMLKMFSAVMSYAKHVGKHWISFPIRKGRNKSS